MVVLAITFAINLALIFRINSWARDVENYEEKNLK